MSFNDHKMCLRCERPIQDFPCTLSLPPHNIEDLQKLCFDCAVEIAFLYSVNKKKEQQNND